MVFMDADHVSIERLPQVNITISSGRAKTDTPGEIEILKKQHADEVASLKLQHLLEIQNLKQEHENQIALIKKKPWVILFVIMFCNFPLTKFLIVC